MDSPSTGDNATPRQSERDRSEVMEKQPTRASVTGGKYNQQSKVSR